MSQDSIIENDREYIRRLLFYLKILIVHFLKCRSASTRTHLSARMFRLTCSLSWKAISTPDDVEVRNVKWAVLSKAKFAWRLKFVQRSGSPGLRWRAWLFLSPVRGLLIFIFLLASRFLTPFFEKKGNKVLKF